MAGPGVFSPFDVELERYETLEELEAAGSGWVLCRLRDVQPNLRHRAVNNGDLYVNGRGAAVLVEGFSEIIHIEPLSVRPTIHADGVVVPALEDMASEASTRVRLKGWADSGHRYEPEC